MKIVMLLSNGKANDALEVCNDLHIQVMFAQTADFALRLCDNYSIAAVIVDEPMREARLIESLHGRHVETKTILFDGDKGELKQRLEGLNEKQATDT